MPNISSIVIIPSGNRLGSSYRVPPRLPVPRRAVTPAFHLLLHAPFRGPGFLYHRYCRSRALCGLTFRPTDQQLLESRPVCQRLIHRLLRSTGAHRKVNMRRAILKGLQSLPRLHTGLVSGSITLAFRIHVTLLNSPDQDSLAIKPSSQANEMTNVAWAIDILPHRMTSRFLFASLWVVLEVRR